MRKVIFLVSIIFLLAAGCSHSGTSDNSNNTSILNHSSDSGSGQAPTPSATPAVSSTVLPVSNAASRITKKLFGTYVTPKNSPVQPERFTGYHTGLDFETFPDEQNIDVPINVICRGKLLRKGYASGYGGYAVESCTINNQAVTVVYGHLRQSSITSALGQELNAGDKLAVLGTGFSTETDGERKHLHLSIHIGTTVNIKGYVQTKAELSGWLDPEKVLGL